MDKILRKKLLNFFKTFKWRIIGFLAFLIIAILFLTLGFWSTILILVLCLIGIGVGYTKDRKRLFKFPQSMELID